MRENTSFLKLQPLLVGVCEWCGKSCSDMDATCSLTCEAQVARLEADRGRRIVRTLMRWRRSRGRKGTEGEGQLMAISKTIDRYLKIDQQRRQTETENRRATKETDHD